MSIPSSNPTYVSPTLVYSARDFDTILAASIQFLKVRYPDRWQDFAASNAGVPLLEVGAYQSAILSWNLDTEIAETYLATARLKDSVLTLAGNVGYVPVGRTASIVLADATMITPPNTVAVHVPAGTPLKALQGLIFEVLRDLTIDPGQLSPREPVASEADTAPRGLTIDFIAGQNDLHFHYGDASGRHSLLVEAGMWIASKGQYPDWYRIASLDPEKKIITLVRPWNSTFEAAFIIKTAGSDAASSRTILSSTPFGTYPASATATLASNIITFSAPLPQTVLPDHWFRLNGLTSCCGAKWFQIVAISPDRTFITLGEPFGPSVPHGFDDMDTGFLIENRSLILVNGSTRVDRFPAGKDPVPQSFRLLATPVIPASVLVTDQDGQVEPQTSKPLPWTRVDNLAEATFNAPAFRAYQLVEIVEDTYEVRFGNGILGKAPTGVITVQYRVGGGPEGNVPVNSFNCLVSGARGNDTVSISISNPDSYGQGGALGEDLNSLKGNIPAYYAANRRAVTGEDYVTLVLQQFPLWPGAAGSIAQASVNQALNAIQYGGNVIYINTWTVGQWSPPSTAVPGTTYPVRVPPSAALLANVQQFLTEYCMVTDVPTVLAGDVDRAIIDVDLQIDSIAEPIYMRLSGEDAILALFNAPTVVSGNPLLLSDLYGVLENLPHVIQARVRSCYLAFADPHQPGSLTVTPDALRGHSDLHPRSLNSIITPGDIRVLVWSLNIGLAIYLSAELYADNDLAKEAIRKDIETYFFDLRPGDGVNIEAIEAILVKSSAGEIKTLADVRVAVGTNVDLHNTQALTVLNLDGLDMAHGDRVLFFGQDLPSENGIYEVRGLLPEEGNPVWALVRAPDAADYNSLSPGSFVTVSSGVTYVGVSFFYDTAELNYATWTNGAKTFRVGNLLDAAFSIRAIRDLASLRLDAPIGNTPLSKPPLPLTMYYLKSLTIN